MNYLHAELHQLLKEDSGIFQFIQESALDGLWYWDLTKPDEEWMSENFWTTLGYDPSEMPHKSSAWQDIIHPDDGESALALAKQHFADPSIPYDQIVRYRHSNGSTVWIRCRGMAIRNENGEPLRMLGAHTDITAQKKKELEAVQNAELYHAFISHAPNAIAMFDSEMCYIAASGQWLKDYGLEGRDIMGVSHYAVFPEIGQEWKDIHSKCLNGHVDKVDEAPFVRADGSTQWLRWEVRPWRRGGEIGGLIMYTEDITERKNEEALLIQYKNLLESSNDVARIGTWEVNLVDMTSTWSDTTKEIHEVPYGFKSTLELGINFYKEGEHRDKISEVFDAALKYGRRFDEELLITTAKGKEKWVRTVGIPEMSDGKCTRVYGILQDIDKSKRAAEVLAAKEELFRNTFEYASIGMALVGLDGSWMKVNRRVAEFLGYSQDELLTLTFQEITHIEDLGSDLELLGQLLDGRIEHYQLEKRYIHKDGHLVWGLLAVSLVKDENGNPLHFISQITDITEQKELLNITSNQNERLMNFAHIVSHNLRSHSGNFSMLLDLIIQDEPTFKESPYYDMFSSASEKLSETIANLNEVVSMQSMSHDALQSKNLLAFINSALTNVKGLLTDVNAEVDVQIDESLDALVIPAYLDSILNNLITNAIKYRSPERRLELTFKARENEGEAMLEVSDNGLGIDLELHGHKMFGMYKTFHRNPEARGIGLFITKNQVETMGGDIDVKSVVGKGTTFIIKLQR
ncbi:MAG: PAS domain S-box protein [Flavobacteriia bacterium]|nr:PAS domain S-box protein [Flavobacteriia bacterium]